MSINMLRSARWLQTFAQMLEVNVQHLESHKPFRQRKTRAGLPVIPTPRRKDHD